MKEPFGWKQFLLSIALVAMGDVAHAQSLGQNVLVLDSLDGTPIAYMDVSTDGVSIPATDVNGRTRIPWNGIDPLNITFIQVGYGTQYRNLDRHTVLQNDVWVVRLLPKDIRLAPLSVGRAAPEPIFQRPDLHAADLLINDEGLWVLAYEHPRMLRAQGDASKEILRHVRLVLLDTLFNEIASCPVPEDVFGLRHDLRNEVVIEGTSHAFGVGRRGDELVLLPFGLEELRQAVLPWTDSIPGWVLGSNADATFPALVHLAFDPVHDTTHKICSVVDTFMMDLFRSEYKYMRGSDKVVAMNLAVDLGVDKETVAGFMNGFSHNIWYRPVYAPLFVVGDTLLVFDHVRWRLRKFTRDLKVAGEVPLTYTAKTEGRYWKNSVIQDRATQRTYAIFQRYDAVWLRSIDPITGVLGDPFRLASEYPERVQVNGGKVYYIWRPSGSLQKRTVYRERIDR